MATIPTLTHSKNDSLQVEAVLTSPLPGSADIFTVVDHCAMFVCVLVECEEIYYRHALCGRLSHALTLLSQRCEEDLPDYLIGQLTAEAIPVSSVPDCWQDTCTLLAHAKALTLALSSNTLMEKNSKELAELLHDIVYLLVDQLKTPFILESS